MPRQQKEESAKPVADSGSSGKKWLYAGIGGVLTAAAVGAWLVASSDDGEGLPPDAVAVTYEVTGEGTVDISYSSGEDGTAETVRGAELPWSADVHVTPAGGPATVTVVLGERGGEAGCTVAVAGQHRQRSTAFGEFGRASCSAEVPGG
ncbi:MmpS family transport accessory protein [Streptomyces sp. JJ38]|uniref:MmpS family transport accessory protein n=1 Tax=Streptomyces sp. JJ38 TaxID=2738128 RepID=UPI001C569869|nr:MmpS family transport accessory protein [Streptomyces sp. JJ38]MBW1596654.1 hypothetical protein [Streptomyces sp. JJ38]